MVCYLIFEYFFTKIFEFIFVIFFRFFVILLMIYFMTVIKNEKDFALVFFVSLLVILYVDMLLNQCYFWGFAVSLYVEFVT